MSTPHSDGERTRFERPDILIDHHTKKRAQKLFRFIVLAVLLVFIVLPLYWSISSAFKTGEALFARPPQLIPTDPTISNFQALMGTDFPTVFMNSVIVAIGAVAISTVLAALGGYGLARSTFRGRRNLARSVLFTYMFPPILLAIPLYGIFYRMGLLNSYLALMLAHTAITLPFGLWVMWQYFQSLPMAFEESAWLNGASRVRALWDVILPMARPSIVAVAIFNFAVSWNDFTFAVVVMTDSSMQTFPVGVNDFIQQTAVHWGLVLSAGVVIMIPPFLLVFFLQKYLLEGFRIGEL